MIVMVMMPMPPDRYRDLGATVQGPVSPEVFDSDQYTLTEISDPIHSPLNAEILSSTPIHSISGIRKFLKEDYVALRSILEEYNFPELEDSIEAYRSNNKHPRLFVEMLENMYRILLSAEFYKNTGVPTTVISKLRGKVQYNYKLITNIFILERPPVYQNMEFGLTNLELGDTNFRKLLVPLKEVKDIRAAKLAEINDLLDMQEVVAKYERESSHT